jgi:hypothetical protein
MNAETAINKIPPSIIRMPPTRASIEAVFG